MGGFLERLLGRVSSPLTPKPFDPADLQDEQAEGDYEHEQRQAEVDNAIQKMRTLASEIRTSSDRTGRALRKGRLWST